MKSLLPYPSYACLYCSMPFVLIYDSLAYRKSLCYACSEMLYTIIDHTLINEPIKKRTRIELLKRIISAPNIFSSEDARKYAKANLEVKLHAANKKILKKSQLKAYRNSGS